MHREAQMVGFIHRHMEDMLCAHGNTTKYVVRFAHGDKIVATILSRAKDNVSAIESLLRLGNQCVADMRRIRCNNNRLAHMICMGRTKSMKQAVTQASAVLRKVAPRRGIQ